MLGYDHEDLARVSGYKQFADRRRAQLKAGGRLVKPLGEQSNVP
jgi:hypothetical protein